jgi:hypothetical protein
VNPVAEQLDAAPPTPPVDNAAPVSPLIGRARRVDSRLMGVLGALLAAAVALAIALGAGVVGVAAVPAVLRTAAVAIAFFAVCGYAPARVLARGGFERHMELLVLPVGAAVSSLALAVLGLAHSPLKLSLAIVIAVALVADTLVYRRLRPWASARPPAPARSAAPVRPAAPARAVVTGRLNRVALPALLAALIGLISLIPSFRAGFATVPGQNGDAVLAVGSAVFLQHEPPTATVYNNLPINHIPIEWRSKYPIYYALAGVTTLSGQDPIQAFPTVSAVMLALTALGFFLFAVYALRAPPWVALLAMFLLPLDRIVMYVTIHPYYNELWGQFTLPFILLFGWRYLSSPNRVSAVLAVLFLALGLFAYPLMLPFPAVFLAVHAWRIYRRASAEGRRPGWIAELRLPRPRQRPILWVPIVVVAVPVVAVLVRGVWEKGVSALQVILPWESLAGWHGNALPFLPFPHFFGVPGTSVADYAIAALVCVVAAVGARRVQRELRWPLVAMLIAAALIGIYFRNRYGGQLFFFKDMAFLGPYVLLLALIEVCALASSPRRVAALAGVAGIAAGVVIVPVSGAAEINVTYDQASRNVLGLRAWDRELPRGSSVRLDVGQNGWELWAMYMFADHPLSALNPIGGFFPHPVVNYKADYVVVYRNQREPGDATGPPLFANAQYRLYRLKADIPGPDYSSRRLIDDASTTTVPGY